MREISSRSAIAITAAFTAPRGEVGVGPYEFGGAGQICRGRGHQFPLALGGEVEEVSLSGWADEPSQQPAGLDEDRVRHQHRLACGGQLADQGGAGAVMTIGVVSCGVERAGVEQDRHWSRCRPSPMSCS